MTAYTLAKEKLGWREAVGEITLNGIANLGHYVLPVVTATISNAMTFSITSIIYASLFEALTYPSSFTKVATLGLVGACYGAIAGLVRAINYFKARGSGWSYGPSAALSYTRGQANQEMQSYLFSPNSISEHGVLPQSLEVLSAYGKERWFGDTSEAVAAWMRGDMKRTCALSGYSERMIEMIEPQTFAAILRVAPYAQNLFAALTPQDIVARIERGVGTAYRYSSLYDERPVKPDERLQGNEGARTSTFLQLVRVCREVDPELLSGITPRLAKECGKRLVVNSSLGQNLAHYMEQTGLGLKAQDPLPWSQYNDNIRCYFEDAYYQLAGVPSLSEATVPVGDMLIKIQRTYHAALTATEKKAIETGDQAKALVCATRKQKAEGVIRDVQQRNRLDRLPLP